MFWKEWNVLHPTRRPRSVLLDFAAVPVEDKIYYFGGHQVRKSLIDVSVFNTVTLGWMKFPPVKTRRGYPVEVPSQRCGHTAVLIGSIIYIWGGMVNFEKIDGGLQGNVGDTCLYAFDIDSHAWLKTNTSGFVPESATGHSACGLGNVMYVYGGSGTSARLNKDIHKFDTTTMVWALINSRGKPPPASRLHSATVIGTKMFVFGGCGETHKHHNNIRVFDTKNNSWLSTPFAQLRPEGRCRHSAFVYKEELYILSGHDKENHLNDVWKLNPYTFSWKRVLPKRKSTWGSVKCFSLVGNRIILFGGYTAHSQPIIQVLDLSPSLKTLCKLAFTQYSLEQKELPHNIRCELAAMTGRKRKKPGPPKT